MGSLDEDERPCASLSNGDNPKLKIAPEHSDSEYGLWLLPFTSQDADHSENIA